MFPYGSELMREVYTGLCAKYGGDFWELNDTAFTTGSNAGICKSGMSNKNPANISGYKFYNTITVSGTLSPDVADTYNYDGLVENGVRYKSQNTHDLGVNGIGYWYITQTNISGNYYYVASGFNNGTDPWAKRWYYGTGVGFGGQWASIAGSYSATGTATGTLVVSNNTNSGIALFVPSGVVLQSAGTTMNGENVKCGAFNGVNGLISETSWYPANAFTFSGWVKPLGTGMNYVFGPRLNNWPAIFLSTGGGTNRPYFNFGSTTARTWVAKDLVSDGKWHHVACTMPGNTVDDIDNSVFYVDGTALEVYATAKGASIYSRTGVFIGKNDAGPSAFNGSIAHVLVIPTALTSSEISMLYRTAKQI